MQESKEEEQQQQQQQPVQLVKSSKDILTKVLNLEIKTPPKQEFYSS
jgi:hypothetical protein